MPSRRKVSKIEAMATMRGQACSLPICIQFLRPTAEELPWDAPAEGYEAKVVRRFTRENPKDVFPNVYFSLHHPEAWGVVEMRAGGEDRFRRGLTLCSTYITITTNSNRRLDHAPRDPGTFRPLPPAALGPVENGIVREAP